MELDHFSLAKRFVHVGDARVAYADQGEGPPVLLLHGCPFSSFVWRNVIPRLVESGHRCLAPDLLGLGDTETPPDADWSLPAQLAMVVGLLDALGLERVDVVGHDHGGAIAQLLAGHHSERIDRLVLCNAEAYDSRARHRHLDELRRLLPSQQAKRGHRLHSVPPVRRREAFHGATRMRFPHGQNLTGPLRHA